MVKRVGNNNGNSIRGSQNNDTLLGRGGNDRLYGLGGNDRLDGGTGRDRLDGGAGRDRLVGGTGNDTVYGRTGNDSIQGGSGSDRLYGGADHDRVIGGSGNDRLMGESGNDRLFGDGDNDYLLGDSGNDTLDGGSGRDSLFGGVGDDIYYVDSDFDQVRESAGQGYDRVYASHNFTLHATLAEVEFLATTNEAATTGLRLTGSNHNNTIRGNAGANIINGRAGADTMIGLGGNDTYYVDDKGDVVIEVAGGGTDRIVTALASYSLASLPEVENLTGTSSAGQRLTGNGGSNELRGAGGNDRLDGGKGADSLYGGKGDDVYFVDTNFDIVREMADGGTDVVIASATFSLASLATVAQVEKLRTSDPDGTAKIDLTGNSYSQSIAGNAGANVINGRGGIDRLTGGSGNDTFVFSQKLDAALNVGHITDFANVSGNNDVIRLDNAIFTSMVTTGVLSASHFAANSEGTAKDFDDFIIFETDSGRLYYDADGAGPAGAIHFASVVNFESLRGAAALSASDFVVV